MQMVAIGFIGFFPKAIFLTTKPRIGATIPSLTAMRGSNATILAKIIVDSTRGCQITRILL